jgi:dolichyl-phosphate beta-glucosyltransferase
MGPVKNQPDLTIVIPAYREERRIGATLDELAGFLRRDRYFCDKAVEVLIVSADAPDKTHEIVLAKRRLFSHLRLLKPGRRAGKGRDVRFGMLEAAGKIVVYMDADLATPLRHLEEFYKACRHGNDIVIGTRDLSKHHPSFIRRSISNIGNVLFRLACGLWLEDSQCGFKMFTQAACQLCFSKMTILGWGFDMEILTIARLNRLKIKSYRIDDWDDTPYSTFTDNTFMVVIRSLKDLGQITWNRLTGKYTKADGIGKAY